MHLFCLEHPTHITNFVSHVRVRVKLYSLASCLAVIMLSCHTAAVLFCGQGRPIYIQMLGQVNVEKMKQVTTEDRMLKFHIQVGANFSVSSSIFFSVSVSVSLSESIHLLDKTAGFTDWNGNQLLSRSRTHALHWAGPANELSCTLWSGLEATMAWHWSRLSEIRDTLLTVFGM